MNYEELICNLCGKSFKANGQEIDHILIRHAFRFAKWCILHRKVFKVANKDDKGEIIASFFKPKDLRDT